MRNLINTIAFLFLGFVTVGCYDNHGPVGLATAEDFFTVPVATSDAGLPLVGDSGWAMPVPDSGTIVTADAGSDAFVPPTEEDAGSDTGPPPEPDAGSDAGMPEVDAGGVICDAVDVPADGSGRVIIRVEGGGDMTVPQDTDFVAFSITIENHTLGPIEGFASFHGSTLSSDCAVRRPSLSFRNECDEMNNYHPFAGSCGGGDCGYTCAEGGPIFASGTSTRFTAYGHTHAAGTFQADVHSFGFLDEARRPLSADRIVGLDMTPLVATITVP